MRIIFRYVYQIDMKFDRQLRPATETSWAGYPWAVSYGGKTIPDGRHFENRYIAISQRKNIRFL